MRIDYCGVIESLDDCVGIRKFLTLVLQLYNIQNSEPRDLESKKFNFVVVLRDPIPEHFLTLSGCRIILGFQIMELA